MKIRSLTAEDWKTWKQFRLEALKNSPESFGSSYEEELHWPDSDFQDGLNKNNIFGAFIDGILVASAGFYSLNGQKTKHRGVIWGMYTKPEYREQGLASALMQAIISFAKSQVIQLHLTCVTKNLPAIKFYNKHGFKVYGTEPRALKIQDAFFDENLMIFDLMEAFHEENKMKHKLGLPLEYQQMPEYFDALNINEKTDSTNALIEKLLKEQKVKTVLDMTCGTGSQVFYLADRGYEIVGSDFSPALLDIARSKAKKMNRNITFIDGDMRKVEAGKFDAVITIFNAIGHLTVADFEKALQNIHANLKEDGVYIFDIFNLQAITDNIIDDFAMDIESIVNGVNVRNVQYSEIDREHGLLTSHDHSTISKKAGDPEIHKNSFSLQIYTAEELQTMLNHNGFKVIGQYDMDGKDFVAEKSLNILTIARKKKA